MSFAHQDRVHWCFIHVCFVSRTSVRTLFYWFHTFLDHTKNISRKMRAPCCVSTSGAPNNVQNCPLDKINMDKKAQHRVCLIWLIWNLDLFWTNHKPEKIIFETSLQSLETVQSSRFSGQGIVLHHCQATWFLPLCQEAPRNSSNLPIVYPNPQSTNHYFNTRQQTLIFVE